MFAPKPFDVAHEMVRVTKPGGRIVMGNWIPGDPTLVAQILKISGSYSPPPPEGFVSPMTWGIESSVIERLAGAGVPAEKISFARDTFTFNYPSPPAAFVDEFRKYYGPTMNAFEAADVVIKAAAPLDFRPKTVASQKIKKSKSSGLLELEATPDILQELGARKNGKVLVGFAAETEDFAKNATAKLKAKNLDFIVVNPVGGPDSGFDSDTNRASIIDASGGLQEIPLVSKSEMAEAILDRVAKLLGERN